MTISNVNHKIKIIKQKVYVVVDMKSYYKISLIVDDYIFNSVVHSDIMDSKYQLDWYKRVIDRLYGNFLEEITKNPIRFDNLCRYTEIQGCPSETIFENTISDYDIKKLKIQQRIDRINNMFTNGEWK